MNESAILLQVLYCMFVSSCWLAAQPSYLNINSLGNPDGYLRNKMAFNLVHKVRL